MEYELIKINELSGKKLTDENYFLRQISEHIRQKMQDKEIHFSDDELDFEGDLTFNTEDYE